MTIKIQVEKVTEEVEIGSSVYTLDLSDEKIEEKLSFYDKFKNKVDKYEGVDIATVDAETRKEIMDDRKETVKEMLESLLGEGTFESVYNDVGRSIVVMSNVIVQLTDVMKNRIAQINESSKSYYTGE
ncbi:hypothetical protein [Niallia sp. RD1]|uniref:hypothetical protein n=1 Tax=Niallia sp. RD1 TaxID=2962858 RepID=UPI0020C1A33D|nr:hypothetical protein [Niallia sp. RD1]UTI41123.1 hypothetical protein NKG37_20015 [Niallia sp. RD1]